MSTQTALQQQGQHVKHDRRRYQRVRVNLLGRFMLEDRHEYPCQIIDMSPGSASLITPVIGKIEERVVAYVDHIGRIEGQVARHIEGGFAMTIAATPRKREKLASQLTWLANRHNLNLREDRRHQRITPANPFAEVKLPDGRQFRCRIIDLSLSGAAITLDIRPPVGSPILLGAIRSTVVRHFDEGIGIEFVTLQTEQSIEENLG